MRLRGDGRAPRAAARPRRRARHSPTPCSPISRSSPDLERSYFAANQRYTDDITSLHFTPVSGAVIAVSYASARTFSASASHRAARAISLLRDRLGRRRRSRRRRSRSAPTPATAPPPRRSRMAAPTRSRCDRAARARHGAAEPARGSDANHASQGGQNLDTIGRFFACARHDFCSAVRGASSSPQRAYENGFRSRARAIRGEGRKVRSQSRHSRSRCRADSAAAHARFADSTRPALACFTRPAFVCGAAGLTYIARGLLRVPPSAAPIPSC